VPCHPDRVRRNYRDATESEGEFAKALKKRLDDAGHGFYPAQGSLVTAAFVDAVVAIKQRKSTVK
jgi:hypothetical protein